MYNKGLYCNAQGGFQRKIAGTCLLLAHGGINNHVAIGFTATTIAIFIVHLFFLMLLLNWMRW
jgi:hypothetical protein